MAGGFSGERVGSLPALLWTGSLGAGVEFRLRLVARSCESAALCSADGELDKDALKRLLDEMRVVVDSLCVFEEEE